MSLIDVVALLALVQYLFFGTRVANARGVYGVKAPAVTGHEMFERAYRVQMNTLELLVVLLPAMYIASRYWSASVIAGAGVVYLVGRLLYWRSYMKDPKGRSPGFALSMLPILALVLAAFVPAVQLIGRP